MNVLVVGSGGREHALCWALRRSRRLRKLFCLPGNAGTQTVATNIAVGASNSPRSAAVPKAGVTAGSGKPPAADTADIALALEVARREEIDLTIVGPEEPLAAGIVDAFEQAGMRIFGPTAAAARLESDKAYAKQIMRQQSVPTADARVYTDYRLARDYIATRDEPLVVKAAGLAKGKGVIVCDDPADALLAAERMLLKREFGDAGARIVVEEKLDGREVSVLALVDGTTMHVLEPAQDHKRLGDGDTGPNTGGMGAFCPTNTIDDATMQLIESQIFVPTLDGLLRDGVRYRGVLYAGLMLTRAGPKVLEFNCRLGDPEAQVVLMRMKSDVLDLFEAAVDGRLDEAPLEWDARAALCVVMASAGYPDSSTSGTPISGLPADGDDAVVFHAATRMAANQVVTAGGRVLGITALGDTLEAARQRAYGVVDGIRFEGAQFRRDIGVAASPAIV